MRMVLPFVVWQPNAPPVILSPYGRLAAEAGMRPLSLSSATSMKAGAGAAAGGGGDAGGPLKDAKVTLGKPRYYAPSRKLTQNDDGFNALSRMASRSASAIGTSRGSYSRSSALKHDPPQDWSVGEMYGPSVAPAPTWNEQRASLGKLPAPMGLHPSLQQQPDSSSIADSRRVPPLVARPTGRRGTRSKNAADSFTRLEPLVWLG